MRIDQMVRIHSESWPKEVMLSLGAANVVLLSNGSANLVYTAADSLSRVPPGSAAIRESDT